MGRASGGVAGGDHLPNPQDCHDGRAECPRGARYAGWGLGGVPCDVGREVAGGVCVHMKQAFGQANPQPFVTVRKCN
jgi:hypothetical protein